MTAMRMAVFFIFLWTISSQAFLSPANSQDEIVTGSATYSGQATVVGVNLGTAVKISDTGPLPKEGGALEASLLELTLPIGSIGTLGAETLHATVIGQGNNTSAEASVLGLNLNLGVVSIGASLLRAQAETTCGQNAMGESEILGLVVNGKPITITGEPNQTINLLVGSIIINEQITNANSIKVNALHVIIPQLADVVLSSASAGIICKGAPPCRGNDFVTGGGFIEIGDSDKKGNFGVAGGIKNNAKWGHLNFIDHQNNIKVKGTAVTAYTVIDQTTRKIHGTCKVNNQTGFTYIATVSDNGEPGTNDTFRLQLSNGYDTTSKSLGGGNIQLHKPCR